MEVTEGSPELNVMKRFGIALAAVAIASTAYAADLPSNIPPLVAPPKPVACGDVTEFVETNCLLGKYGITLYGTVDLGVAWQSHGTPFNGAYTTGLEYLVSKNSNRALWSAAPNALSQSNLGIKGLEGIVPGWSLVFDLEAGFDPYSLQLANGPKSLVQNNGVPLDRQSSNGDSSRGGQFYNSLGYVGLMSPTFGTFTAGRQNSLTLDGVIAYDPQGASYAFSPIGYSGVTSGVGDTEDAKFTTSLKYKIQLGQFRAAALYQFGGYGAGNPSNSAYQVQFGGDFLSGPNGKLSIDAIYSYVEGAVSASALNAAQNTLYPGTLAATLSNNSSEMLLAKYMQGPATIFGGYEHIQFSNPSRAPSTFSSIAGYTVKSENIVSTVYTNKRNLHVFWIGMKYHMSKSIDLMASYYEYFQQNYKLKPCSNTSSAACSGALHAVSVVLDWSLSPKLDAYSGVMVSEVENGLASGFLHHVSADPAMGLRFRF